ncbi:hypothetical protein GQ53DRAFT_499214 [Thozetella sp. PMI_491]|nr:hypothetical protein GQ53DRAFT_499214 [Thozetella sp. PMI_491]
MYTSSRIQDVSVLTVGSRPKDPCHVNRATPSLRTCVCPALGIESMQGAGRGEHNADYWRIGSASPSAGLSFGPPGGSNEDETWLGRTGRREGQAGASGLQKLGTGSCPLRSRRGPPSLSRSGRGYALFLRGRALTGCPAPTRALHVNVQNGKAVRTIRDLGSAASG